MPNRLARMSQCTGRFNGALNARILIIGLAPGLRGANRTGRPFTGDGAGGYLFEMLA